MNDKLKALIGIGAFFIGGLLASEKAMEGVDATNRFMSETAEKRRNKQVKAGPSQDPFAPN